MWYCFTAAHCFWIDGLTDNIRRSNKRYLVAAGKIDKDFSIRDSNYTQISGVSIKFKSFTYTIIQLLVKTYA